MLGDEVGDGNIPNSETYCMAEVWTRHNQRINHDLHPDKHGTYAKRAWLAYHNPGARPDRAGLDKTPVGTVLLVVGLECSGSWLYRSMPVEGRVRITDCSEVRIPPGDPSRSWDHRCFFQAYVMIVAPAKLAPCAELNQQESSQVKTKPVKTR